MTGGGSVAANTGRKAAPAALRLVEGRGNGRDSGGRVVKPPPGFARLAPDAPDWLYGDARELWEATVPELVRLDLLKPIDGPALTAYCLAWQRMRQAQRFIDDAGGFDQLFEDGKRHPVFIVLEAASKELRAWAAEFGLTPAAEGKVSSGGDDGGAENPFG